MKDIDNILKHEGINAKGFGTCPKLFMQDPRLSIQAKGIYAYFCSYLGAGATIFPKRNTILKDLNLSKNGYYKHFNQLIEYGYIKVEKMNGYLNRNTYIICSDTIKTAYNETAAETENQNSVGDTISVTGINNTGYGFVPKLVMTDTRLTIKAKALLIYFYTLTSAGSAAFPTRDEIWLHQQLKKDAYYSALNQLIETNYISVKQRKNTKGQFTGNHYYLNLNPDTDLVENTPILSISEPRAGKRDNAEYTQNIPCAGKGDIEQKPCAENEDRPCTENRDNTYTENEDNINNTNSNSTTINNHIYSDKYIHIQEVQRNNMKRYDTYYDNDFYAVQEARMPAGADTKFIVTAIKKLSMYDDVMAGNENMTLKKIYMLAVNSLVEMATTRNNNFYCHSWVTAEQIIQYINLCFVEDEGQFSIRDMLYGVVQNYYAALQNTRIHNPVKYMKSCLYNGLISFDNFECSESVG